AVAQGAASRRAGSEHVARVAGKEQERRRGEPAPPPAKGGSRHEPVAPRVFPLGRLESPAGGGDGVLSHPSRRAPLVARRPRRAPLLVYGRQLRAGGYRRRLRWP